ncbi:class I SAM-dependent methyltransferase [Massilibacteroides sp.]|uniref:class I SAM-dependent methyltransferase n=1 Tax=Massilibacteroides sp. TaxID=2034766 RepID=UPI002604D1BF|nr:class I SAM-dependent methyltransferase [Massilibacteroides sp.]MDD4516522.1 class I SAM-dependent methyltransferase [Massilibacteroides sp.]
METIDYKIATTQLYKKISAVNFEALPISNYNKNYIRKLTPSLFYFLDIYTACFKNGLRNCNKGINELILVDFGGGSGFLSMLAKEIGIGKVIYIDINEKSVETIKLLKTEIGIGPDIILHGDSKKLSAWCTEQNIQPDLLIATDVIEHIYDLFVFFHDLIEINDQIKMVFTTASTPYNPLITRRLHRYMRGCETGRLEKPNYYTKRVNFIKKEFPNLGRINTKKWATRTRGLMYEDIHKAISKNERPLLVDAYNTCDPETGNWAERILPIRDYKELAKRYGYEVETEKGFYNIIRPKQWKSSISILVNQLIKYSGKAGFLLAPFIILSFGRK